VGRLNCIYLVDYGPNVLLISK